MRVSRYATLPSLLAASLAFPASAAGDANRDPLRFFEGSTEGVSVVKVILSKQYRTHEFGEGKIRGDGALELVQRVEREGHPTTVRRWLIRQVGPGRYTGSMSDATGPVNIEEVDGRYRFRFEMKGHLAVEQWLTPQQGWHSAKSSVTIKRFGIRVGTSEGVIHKVG
jgi:hypothetical protein